jgi:hypothetical protein
MYLRENPDTVTVDGKKFYYADSKCISFAIMPGEKSAAISTSPDEGHHDLLGRISKDDGGATIVGNTTDFYDKSDTTDPYLGGDIVGRFWLEPQVASFWSSYDKVMPAMPFIERIAKEAGINLKVYKFDFYNGVDKPEGPYIHYAGLKKAKVAPVDDRQLKKFKSVVRGKWFDKRAERQPDEDYLAWKLRTTIGDSLAAAQIVKSLLQ